jgi:YD repeat-containing protein
MNGRRGRIAGLSVALSIVLGGAAASQPSNPNADAAGVREVRGYVLVDGVNVRTGNYSITYPAFERHGIAYRRTYNSQGANADTFGSEWGSTFDTRIYTLLHQVVAIENGNGAATVYGDIPSDERSKDPSAYAKLASGLYFPLSWSHFGRPMRASKGQEMALACGMASITPQEVAEQPSGYSRIACGAGGVQYETYDAFGHLTGYFTPGGAKVALQWDDSGRLQRAVDDQGHSLTFTRDPDRTWLTVTDETGDWLKYEFDDEFRNTRLTGRDASPLKFGYDAKGRLSEITYVDQTSVKIAYDVEGRATKVVNRFGKPPQSAAFRFVD